MCTENKKAPAGVEPTISCLLDRRFNQLSHGAAGVHNSINNKSKEKQKNWTNLSEGILSQDLLICSKDICSTTFDLLYLQKFNSSKLETVNIKHKCELHSW